MDLHITFVLGLLFGIILLAIKRYLSSNDSEKKPYFDDVNDYLKADEYLNKASSMSIGSGAPYIYRVVKFLVKEGKFETTAFKQSRESIQNGFMQIARKQDEIQKDLDESHKTYRNMVAKIKDLEIEVFGNIEDYKKTFRYDVIIEKCDKRAEIYNARIDALEKSIQKRNK
jgi:Fe2+ or Zn2+ uptake regulation protein